MDDDDALSKRANQERLLISKLSKEDLEDKYLNIYDENIILKKHARKQEDRIKKMATKLVRLINDKKKSMNQGGDFANLSSTSIRQRGAGGAVGRDLKFEEQVSELEGRNFELEQQNRRLKENLQVTKTQLQTLQTQKNSVGNVYSNVTARIDTGLPRKEPSLSRTNIRTISTANAGNISARSFAPPTQTRQFQELEYENIELKTRIDQYESQIHSLQNDLNKQRAAYEESLYNLRNQVSHDQMSGVQENIDQIRLQRELKDKSNQYAELHAKYNNLSMQHDQLKMNHNHMLDQIEHFNMQLKQEQQRNASLKTEIKNLSINNRELFELKQRVDDLSRDNEVLSETNAKLLNSAFSLEREREFRERERVLKIQIAQLEATLKSDVGEKGSILDRLNTEREQYDKINKEMREMQVKYLEMKQKYDDMNEKVQFLNKESNIDFSEIEEALMLVRERRSNKPTDEFSHLIDSEKIKAYQRKLVNLEADLAETVAELNKSRHLLITQVKINEEFKNEMKLIQGKMEDNKADYDAKMLEYAQLLDIRAARIKKLERQLKDIAYGTKQVKIKPQDDFGPLSDANPLLQKGKRRDSYSFVGAPAPHMLDHYLTANLERGQNIFEIHIIRVVLSEEAIRMMNEPDPSTFCTVEFYEHELQTTPVRKGAPRVDYDFTSQYVIRVDDFFLHYLQKETATIELHQAVGSDYETRAACQLSFRDLIEKQTSRLHGAARLLCVNSSNVGMTFGSLEYWARLIVPVDEAFRLYKEKTKALGYLATNQKAIDENEKKPGAKPRSVDNMNELNINILRCSKITSLQQLSNGGKAGAQPSPYCVYKFFDFDDHDTEIIAASNYPEFNDHRAYAVHMDIDLDKYLKSYMLEIYVFDDNEPEDSGTYLGVAKIPLIELAHSKDIKGTYELKTADGKSNGTMDVTMYWQYMYAPPAASTFSVSGSKHPTRADGDRVAMLPNESLDQSPMSMVEKARKMGFKLPKPNAGASAAAAASNSKPGSRKPSLQHSDQASAANGNRQGSQQPPSANNISHGPSSRSVVDRNHPNAGDMNKLLVNILRCSEIYAHNGTSKPSAYCVYTFFNSPEHATRAVPDSHKPEFNDEHECSVRMDAYLERYLQTSPLQIYVFDRNDSKSIESGEYIGMAKVPLVELSRDRGVIESLPLLKADGTPNGRIDVSLHWQYTYRSSSSQPASRQLSRDDEPIMMMKQQNVGASKSSRKSPANSPKGYHSPAAMSPPPGPDEVPFEILSRKRASIVSTADEDTEGNATIHHDDFGHHMKQQNGRRDDREDNDRPHAPSPPHRSSTAENQHYNDTMFGDDQPRTYSPNELDTLQEVYQRNVTDDPNKVHSDEDNDIEEEIGKFGDDDDDEQNEDENEERGERGDRFADTLKGNNTFGNTASTDNDIVKQTWDPNNTNKMAKEGNQDNVIIEISSFSLKEGSSVLNRDEVKKLFVSFEFLNYDLYELESPALPKPPANVPSHYNFRKIFPVDSQRYWDKRQKLAEMIVDQNKSMIRFALVYEPEKENKSQDCEDIGYAYVDINDILNANQNYINKEIKLFDADNPKQQIGKILVTVEILDALLAIKNELAMDQTT